MPKTILSNFYNVDGFLVANVYVLGKKFYVDHFIESLDDWEIEGPFNRQCDAEDNAEDYANE